MPYTVPTQKTLPLLWHLHLIHTFLMSLTWLQGNFTRNI